MNRSKWASLVGIAAAVALAGCNGSTCDPPRRMVGEACVMPCPSGYCYADGAVADVPAPADASDTGPTDTGPADIGTTCDASTSSDPLNCGTCGHVCSPDAHGTATCSGGVCGTACSVGYHLCSGVCADDTAPTSCGASCSPCPAAQNGMATCSSGVCGTACNTGFHECSGVCANNQSTVTCGSSCAPCSAAPANAITSCDGTACGFTCVAGFAPMSGSCVALGAPRPVGPPSTSIVTSRRPALRWALAPAADGAHVQVCRDRACATVVTEFDAAGSSGAPAADLPSGVLFWRLQSRMGGTTATASSPVWQFSVGTRSAAVNTAWGTTFDINGDGFADLAAGVPGSERIYIYLGSAAGLGSAPVATIGGVEAGGHFGASVASAGDVNGDGFADLIVGAPYANSRMGRAYVYLGGPSGLLSTTAAAVLSGVDPNGYFGVSVSSAGDVDGDGYGDVVVGAPQAAAYLGHAFVFRGSGAGVLGPPAASLVGTVAVGQFGSSIASAGDVNGDGFADIVVGATGAGAAYVFDGRSTGIGATPSATLVAVEPGTLFGSAVAGAGDVDGNGYADVVVGDTDASSHAGRAYVYLGSATGISTTAGTTVGVASSRAGLGGSVASAGDVNGDGYGDLLLGAYLANSGTGQAYVVLGGASLPPMVTPTASATLSGNTGSLSFGYAVAGVGDVNGDGYGDVAIGAPDGTSPQGQAYIFAGTASGVSSSATTTLPGSDPGGQLGYALSL